MGSHPPLLFTFFDRCLMFEEPHELPSRPIILTSSISAVTQLRPNTHHQGPNSRAIHYIFPFFFLLRDWVFHVGRSVSSFLPAKIDIIASDEPAAQVSEVRSGCFILLGFSFAFFFCLRLMLTDYLDLGYHAVGWVVWSC